MHLALSDLFRARWSNMIHEEWIRNLHDPRPDLPLDKLYRVRDLMNAHVRGGLVSGFEPLIDAIGLPDPNDRHVVAVGIHTRAEMIVTFNLKDFPADALAPYNLTAQHPDDFILDLIDLNVGAVIQAARDHRASLKNPPLSVEHYLDCLLRQGLPQTVSELRRHSFMI